MRPLRGAGDTRRRVARGSGALGSAQARQSSHPLRARPRPRAASDGSPGPPRPTRGHRLPSFALPPTGRGDPSGHGRCGCGRSPRPAQPGARHRQLSFSHLKASRGEQRARRPRAGRWSWGCGLGRCASRPASALHLEPGPFPPCSPWAPQWSKPNSHAEPNPFACPWTAKLNGHDRLPGSGVGMSWLAGVERRETSAEFIWCLRVVPRRFIVVVSL